jgi:hypothetical protein
MPSGPAPHGDPRVLFRPVTGGIRRFLRGTLRPLSIWRRRALHRPTPPRLPPMHRRRHPGRHLRHVDVFEPEKQCTRRENRTRPQRTRPILPGPRHVPPAATTLCDQPSRPHPKSAAPGYLRRPFLSLSRPVLALAPARLPPLPLLASLLSLRSAIQWAPHPEEGLAPDSGRVVNR